MIYFAKMILSDCIAVVKQSTDVAASSYGIPHWVDDDGNDYGQCDMPNLGVQIFAVRTSGTDSIVAIAGKNVDLDDVALLMDDDIRESVHADLAPCPAQDFADEYCKRHLSKYGKQFLAEEAKNEL